MNTDWLYLSARQLVAHLKSGEISSRALLETYIARINDKNGQINAVVALDLNAARARADAADAAIANGENWGPLHGLPVTIKDTFEVAGMPCTAGAEEFRHHVPTQAAFAVQKMIDAGAIVFAKTNVPVYAGDIQSYNDIYGVSNNPWNPALTPGGSSGGAAAALAAGFTSLELGSDLAGSIRIPSHFCGVYGHKVTHGVITMNGHIPGPPGVLKEPDLAVAGPMARSADDLLLLLDVVAGASPLMAAGWHLKLPAAKQKKLKDFRVLLWINDPLCAIDQQMVMLYQQLQQKLQASGVAVTVGAPLGMKLDDFYPLYLRQLGSLLGLSQSKMQRRLMGLAAPLLAQAGKYIAVPKRFEHFLEGVGQSYRDWHLGHEKSLRLRKRFMAVFDQYDVVLMPATATTALKHQHRPDLGQRRIKINGQERSYTEMFMWISPASLLGLPATSAPIGVTPQGLPVNVQIMGAPYHDKTTIKFAALLAEVMGGFTAPPGF